MKQVIRVAFGFYCGHQFCNAEVRIVIDSGVDSGRPIGVVPFQWRTRCAPEDTLERYRCR